MIFQQWQMCPLLVMALMAMNYVQLIVTQENVQEMSNDMPPASNKELTTGLASYLTDELIF